MTGLQKQMRHGPVQQATLKIWAIGLAAFGETWTYKYGDIQGPTFKVWARELRLFQPEDIAEHGERILTRWDKGRPPYMGEFLRELRVMVSSTYKVGPPALPKPKRKGRPLSVQREQEKIYAFFDEAPPTREELVAKREAREARKFDSEELK